MEESFIRGIIEKEFLNESFSFFKEIITDEYVYVFVYNHRLIYPIMDDRLWYVRERGPVLIDKQTKEYKVLQYSDFISNHYELQKKIFSEVEFNLSNDCTYDFVVDLVKERKYLNFGDIIFVARGFNFDEGKIQYCNSADQFKKTEKEIMVLLFEEYSYIDNYISFINDIGLEYTISKNIITINRLYNS